MKSRATRRSNSTWSSSGTAGCPAGKVERRLVMFGVRLPEEGGPVGTIFPSASFGNLLQRKLLANLLKNPSENIRLSDELRGNKDELLRVAQEFGLEGLVAKRPNSVYESGRRSGIWVKFKITKSQGFLRRGPESIWFKLKFSRFAFSRAECNSAQSAKECSQVTPVCFAPKNDLRNLNRDVRSEQRGGKSRTGRRPKGLA